MAQGKAKDDRAKMLIYPNWADMLMTAPPEYCQQLFTAMWLYRNGTPYESLNLDPITATLFAGVKAQLDLDMQNYAETKARNQENGKKHSAAPKATEANPTGTQNNPVGSSGIPDEPKATRSGADKDKDKVNVKDNALDIPPKPPEGADADEPAPIPEPETTRKPKRSVLNQAQQERFNRWYAVYPRKVGKDAALRAWAKLNPDDALTDEMIRAVETQKQRDSRFRETQFTPHPATWLNAGEWQNEYGDPPQPQARSDDPYTDWTKDPDWNPEWNA